MAANTITFALPADGAAITKRAAARVGLDVTEHADGTFTVHLRSQIDAYHLGNETASDPGWAKLFPYGGRDDVTARRRRRTER